MKKAKPDNKQNSEEWVKRKAWHLSRIETDTRISNERNPLRVPELRGHLKRYVSYWRSEPTITKYFDNYNLEYTMGPGCMVCGEESSFHVFIVKHGLLPSYSFFWQCIDLDWWETLSREYEVPDTSLRSCYQALWRIFPEVYFEHVPFFPLKHVPLLFLCSNCVDAFKGSHEEIPEQWKLDIL